MSVDLSIIIPVYNEGNGLYQLRDRVINFLNGLQDTIAEVIFVDDCSVDNSAAILKEICSADSRFRYYKLARNRGSHIAILAGMSFSKGRCVVFLAADLQDPPELISKMMEKWKEGFKVVWAVREKREGISFLQKKLAKFFYYIFNKLASVKLPPDGSDFAVLDKTAVDAVIRSAGSTPSLGALIAWVGFSQTEVKYTKEARKFGSSKWTFRKKINAFIDSIVAFSYLPMRYMISVGFFIAIAGFVYALVIIILNIIGTPIVGWSSTMVAILLLGGIQMVMMGVLGEYLWRNLEESRRRPLFFIEESSEKL